MGAAPTAGLRPDEVSSRREVPSEPGAAGVAVISFGCRLNLSEGEVMKREAEAAGLGRDGTAILVNTCAVTAEAVRQAGKAVRRARREHPHARIVVSGCAAQIDPARFAAMPEVDAVLGNEEKMLAASYRALPDFGVAAAEKIRVNDVMSIRETAGHMAGAIEGRVRGIVQVQNGCDHRCTFCIIPFGRGNSRSVPMGAVVDAVKRLAGLGTKEIVLSGVDMTGYGADLPGRPRLGTLVQAILRHVPDLSRLRLSSIDSVEADAALVDAIGSEPRLMPHLHLSLQSGDDLILKRMKRRHTRGDAVRFCADIRARRPDVVFGADIIAGFPTETEAMFERSLSLVADCGLTHVHAFPFSARSGTPAARMPPCPPGVVKARAARLRAAGERALQAHLGRSVGLAAPVLVERGGRGRLPDFTPCSLDFGLPGEIVGAVVTGHDGQRLRAEPLCSGPSQQPRPSLQHGKPRLHG